MAHYSATQPPTSLQRAYETGNTIDVTTAEGSPTISNSADVTDNLTIARTFVGAGDGIDITMGAGTTGDAIRATVVAGQDVLTGTDGVETVTVRPNLVQVSTGGRVLTGTGTDTDPSLSSTNDPNSGFRFPGGDIIRVVLGGTTYFLLHSDGNIYANLANSGLGQNSVNSYIKLMGQVTSGAGEAVRLTNLVTFSGAGNAQIGTAIRNTINQTLAASFSDLFIDRTQTAAGSGAQRLIDARVGNTPQFVVTNTGEVGAGGAATPATTVDIAGDLATRVVSPAALAGGNNNDYAGANGRSFARLTPGVNSTITGLADGQDGRLLTLVNLGAADITIANQNANSAAANRIITLTGADEVLNADDVMMLVYDPTTARWRQLAAKTSVGAMLPTTIAPDDTASAGTSGDAARADHRHAIAAAAPSTIGTANTEGVSTSFARADHVHDAGASRQIQARYAHAGDALATDTVSERAFYRARGAETLFAIYYIPRAAQAGDDTNNFTITIRKRDGSGGAAVTVVAYTNNVASGGMAAFDPKDLGALANTAMAADNILTFELTKGGTGQMLTAGTLIVDITRDT